MKKWSVYMLIVGLVFSQSCKSDDDANINVELNNEINEFVWFAMNGVYFWNEQVDDLSIEKYPTFDRLYSFLNSYPTPEGLFADLLHPDDNNRISNRPYSFIVSDYEVLEASFQGEGLSFGFDFGLLRIENTSNIFGYVRYVVPNSPADQAGLQRGDLFTRINDTVLDENNFSTLLSADGYKIGLAEIENNTIKDLDESLTINAANVVENPILLSKIIETGAGKVGYLMYNQFINNNAYHRELNDIFGQFKSQGISEFVLDLRYNGGGSVSTAQIVASQIYGAADASTLMGTIVYNSNLAERFNEDFTFKESLPIFNNRNEEVSSETLNRLAIDRIFVLTSSNTASASELLIAALQPYINVVQIGTTTIGKNVGSTTIYDSDSFSKDETLNPNHTYAMQPIISKLANSAGFSDYTGGLVPLVEINEADFVADLKPLGDENEALFSEALGIITGVARKKRSGESSGRYELVFTSGEENEMIRTVLLDHVKMPKLAPLTTMK